MRVRKRRLTNGQKVTLGVAAAIAVGLPGWFLSQSYLGKRDAALFLAREATVDGPPCPSLTKAQFEARGLKVKKATLYEGVTFARQFGHMDCRSLRYGAGWGTEVYPVCQFTSPRSLKVTTPKGEWYFDPGPGQPATVGAPHGQARCVMASNFNMKNLTSR
ncbi:MAG: hypothetical protein EPO51_18205 [Phenylobacterium sp.]|uniref:hypothetical protein n=1 Tax=Phenylobacterium sp. TaxID=1871053 RepID=UPI0011FED927|nr:hypothetical protein [Phenylobacterium sp.]TAJ70462.1 MAG: hypothetical protein EPO51_18205 [Phenylobacterium sp.]